MKITIDFEDFKPWSGGKEVWDLLTNSEREQLESNLEDIYPEGMTDTQLNDLLWHDTDTVAELLGYRNGQALYDRDSNTWKEHYKEILQKEYHYVDEATIDLFVDFETADDESDSDIIKEFDEWWKNDDYQGRANILLSRKYDSVDEEIIDEYIENFWDEDSSDEDNFKAFDEYYKNL